MGPNREPHNGSCKRKSSPPKPTCQQTRAPTAAQTLKPTVSHPNQTHKHNSRTEPKEHVHQSRRPQTEGNISSCIRTVAEKPIRKLRYAIDHSVKREKQTQL